MTAYDQDQLAAVEACFMQASRLLYCEPNDDEVAAQVQERLFEAAPYGMDNPSVQQGLRLLCSWCDEAAGALAADPTAFAELVAALRREWLRLFVGAGTPDAPCWESYYIEPNSILFVKCTLEVREAYRAHDLQIERLHSEPDDHLSLMLGFMGHLVGQEADAVASGNSEAAAHAASEQEKFLAKHILPWLAVWRYAVDKYATSDYYKGVGEFVFGLCARYAQRFDIAFDDEAQGFKRIS